MGERDKGTILPYEDTDPEQTKIQKTLKQVVGFHLAEDLKKNPSKTDQERYRLIEKRIAIYRDALDRGEPLLQEKLKAAPVDINVYGGLASRHYYYEGTALVWQLEPKFKDPFEQARFYRDAQSSSVPLKGETTVWTDPFLINEMLQIGLRKQETLYSPFISCIQAIGDLNERAVDTLNHLDPVKEQFNRFIKVYLRLKKAAASPEALKENFIQLYVVPHDPLLDEISETHSLTEEVLKIHQLFREEGQPIKPTSRSAYQHTVVIEILSNPEAFKKPQALVEPKTTVEQVYKVAKLLARIHENASGEAIKYELGFIAYQALAQVRTNLEDDFLQLGISPSLGMEYIQTLLRDIDALPGLNLIMEDHEGWEDFSRHTELNFSYRFIKHIRRVKVERDELIGTELFLNNLVAKRIFLIKEFRLLPDQFKEYLMTRIFAHELLPQKYNYKEIVKKLFRLLDLHYSPAMHLFINHFSRVDRTGLPWHPKERIWKNLPWLGQDLPWVDRYQREFLRICRDKITAGDLSLTAILEDTITSQAFCRFVASLRLPKNYHSFQRSMSSLNSDVKFGKKSKDVGVETLAQHAAGLVMFTYYEEGKTDEVKIQSNIHHVVAAIERNYDPPSASGPNVLLTNQKAYAQFFTQVQQEVNNLRQRFQHEYLCADYPEGLPQTLTSILENSLEWLQKEKAKFHLGIQIQ